MCRYKGVYVTTHPHASNAPTFWARITHKGKKFYLGCYSDAVSAAQAYDKAAICAEVQSTPDLSFASSHNTWHSEFHATQASVQDH